MSAQRKTALEAFQPTVKNSKALAKLKPIRGAVTQTINTALDHHFRKAPDKTVAELTLKVLADFDKDGASARDVLTLRTLCEEALGQ